MKWLTHQWFLGTPLNRRDRSRTFGSRVRTLDLLILPRFAHQWFLCALLGRWDGSNGFRLFLRIVDLIDFGYEIDLSKISN